MILNKYLTDENAIDWYCFSGLKKNDVIILKKSLEHFLKTSKEINPARIQNLIRVLNEPERTFIFDDNIPVYVKQKTDIEYIDLGLPSGNLWADRNIGASAPEQAGLYFAWGETEGFTAEQVVAGWRSFNRSSYKAKEIAADLTPEQDAARAYLGENFYMPTKEDFEELLANCDATWTDSYKGTKVSGHVFTSKTNGNSIFFPTAGRCIGSSMSRVGSVSSYWSASWHSPSFAWDLYFPSGDQGLDSGSRCYGRSVRGVCKKA